MNIFKVYDKVSHFERAKELLCSESEINHIYACLELRFCIEAIVYQKLLHGIDSIPNTIIEEWRPNKALKMLKEIDEFADGNLSLSINSSISITPPIDGWLKLGDQKLPKTVQWLAKSYNTLGNLLHLKQPSKITQKNKKNIIDTITPIMDELEQLIQGNLVISLKNNNIKINSCPVCKEEFFFDTKKINNEDLIRCKNHQCHAIFIAHKDKSQKITFKYNTFDIKCLSCNQLMIIEEKKIRDLEVITCNHCCSDHSIKADYSIGLIPKN
tara:strand:- start:12999 stop:13808 length:810 start_codon:yes stop_codon:yes gene_type:complete